MADKSELKNLKPDQLHRNPANPRVVFREHDMQVLLESIRAVGVKVPVSVYRERTSRYILIDGERRWRCTRKLNLATIPAIVQPKPSPLENLLMMFNIHNVRVDWDWMPTAYKLVEIQGMLEQSGQASDFDDLAGFTGLSKSMVRTCFELLELPKRYRDELMREAEKPKGEQRITPDLFVEINKSQRVIQRYAPEVFEAVTPRRYLDTMVRKYKQGVVTNVVRFRDVSKIARAERAGEDRDEAIPVLIQLVEDPAYKIEDAFQDSVKAAYEDRDLVSRSNALAERLKEFDCRRTVPTELHGALISLREEIERVIGDD